MSKDATRCPECGTEIFADRDACSQCGAPLPPSGVSADTKYCQQCGQQLQANAAYCDRCGTQQSAEQQPPPTRDHSQSQDGGGLSRRQLITGGVGVAALAGIGVLWVQSSTPTHQAVGQESWQSHETESTAVGETIHGVVELDSGEYTGQSFWNEGALTLGVNIKQVTGGEIDVWTIPDSAIDAYRDGETGIEHYTNLSKQGVSSSLELADTVPSGEWWVLLDNSGIYGSDSSGSVTVEFAAGIGL